MVEHMEPDFTVYLIVLPVVFLAGLVDAIAGGGGLLSLPAYFVVNLPPHLALGTNKFSACAGTSLATLRFFKKGLIDFKTAGIVAGIALIGSHLGARCVQWIDADVIRWCLLIVLPIILILSLFKMNGLGRNATDEVQGIIRYLLISVMGMAIGFYDGLFGPGTGSFLIMFFLWGLRYDIVSANANTKFVNLATNLSALLTFMAADKVYYQIAVPAALASVSGNWLGSQMVLKKGVSLIRPIFMMTLALLLIKILFDLLNT